MKQVISSLKICWDVHDNWTELLAGTRLVLDLMSEERRDNIDRTNLLRLTLVSASQMTEVMFFKQLNNCAEKHSQPVKSLLAYDLEKRISFNDARKKWPEILTGKAFDLGAEPFQSMTKLSALRNEAVHHSAKCPKSDLGESALYTSIESSRAIYEHFNPDGWKSSQYRKFVKKYNAKSSTLLRKIEN
ncbi:MAG: hypothetical protein GQ532_16605 [Methylomarinum sp.]|nr:hypothetical protein [Methylomarinum sp.]